MQSKTVTKSAREIKTRVNNKNNNHHIKSEAGV